MKTTTETWISPLNAHQKEATHTEESLSFSFTFTLHFSYLILLSSPRQELARSIRCDVMRFIPIQMYNIFARSFTIKLIQLLFSTCFFFSLSLFLSVCLISPIHSDGWGWARGKDEFWNKTKKNLNCALWRMKFMPQFHFKQRWSYKMKWIILAFSCFACNRALILNSTYSNGLVVVGWGRWFQGSRLIVQMTVKSILSRFSVQSAAVVFPSMG